VWFHSDDPSFRREKMNPAGDPCSKADAAGMD